MVRKTKSKWEYGDFQTPQELAEQAVSIIHRLDIKPRTIIEPTCGKGSFLIAAAQCFSDAQNILGADVNKAYLDDLEINLSTLKLQDRISLISGDFFNLNWSEILNSLPEPMLIVGNPPWVTSAELGILKSTNIPQKSNFQGHRGFDAITGKSNFDISEWMILKHLDWLSEHHGMIGMLCKTSVARKVLSQAWKHRLPLSLSRLYLIDAQKYFGASIDACFLVIDMLGGAPSTDCFVYENIKAKNKSQTIGYHDGLLIANLYYYKKWMHLKGTDESFIWRSGIKHDCVKVMELERLGNQYCNGSSELIALEDYCVYPMLKSSDIGNCEVRYGRKYMIVTQKYVGEDTSAIKHAALKTWQYLENHDKDLANRASSIYKNRPKFSIFGVGSYSFSPWKVAVSGFYKHLSFRVINPYEDKPVVLDDTIYFIPCWSAAEAHFLSSLLNSNPAQEFYNSMIFWTNKRPVTIEILKRLNIRALSVELNSEDEYLRFSLERLHDRSKSLTN